MEEIKNPYALFAENQETYEEAVKKSTDESQSFQRTKHFRMDSAGTYTVRILPLAPAEQPDGSYKLERKGYEYPVKTQVLKLDNPRPTGKKDKQFFVNISLANPSVFCHLFHGFFLIDSLVHIVIHMLLNRHFFPFCALLL